MDLLKFIKFKKKNKDPFFKGKSQCDLIIFDDIYPHPISGFRLEEYNVLLEYFTNSKIYVNPRSYAVFKATEEDHKNDVKALTIKKPFLKNKINVLKDRNDMNTKLFYCVFLNNIYEHLEMLESLNIPFAFTLYPGGGFVINEEEVDFKLKRVLGSKMFRGVIVTQQFSLDYLVSKQFCDTSLIKLVFGCVVPQESLQIDLSKKVFYSEKKNTFDVCFCAAKYTELGEDKGYDVFIAALTVLTKKYKFIRVHVIGGFDATVIDITEFKDQITFYGYQKFEDLSGIYQNMDVFVSPNKPFVLYPGGFDGFPLGTAIEAGLNGVALILTDELDENKNFLKGEELLIIKPNKEDLISKIELLINDSIFLEELSLAGKEKIKDIYSNNYQMKPRIEFLNAIITK